MKQIKFNKNYYIIYKYMNYKKKYLKYKLKYLKKKGGSNITSADEEYLQQLASNLTPQELYDAALEYGSNDYDSDITDYDSDLSIQINDLESEFNESINLALYHDLEAQDINMYNSQFVKHIEIPMSLINTEDTIQKVKEFISGQLDNEQNVRPIDIDLYYLISDTNTLKRLNNNESFSPLLDYNELIGMFITLYITTKTDSEYTLKQKGFNIEY